jgi:glucokinase
MDIGGSKAVTVLGRGAGDIVAEDRIDGWACGSWERDLETLVAHTRQLCATAGVELAQVAALGISAPGPLDPAQGVVTEAPNLPGWVQVPLVARLEQALGVPCLLENDANAAALAEWRFGAGRGRRSLIFLTMSTGVGGGLILDGRLYRGARFTAGEVGHVPVVPNGRLCNCGLRGCLEAYTSGNALAERMREDIAAGESTLILERAGGDPGRVSTRHWIEALRAGDAYAQRLRTEFIDRLAQGITILLLALDVECFVLGTIVQQNPELFLEDLREQVRERVWPTLQDVELLAGELGARLPAYAALSVAELAPAELGLRP